MEEIEITQEEAVSVMRNVQNSFRFETILYEQDDMLVVETKIYMPKILECFKRRVDNA